MPPERGDVTVRRVAGADRDVLLAAIADEQEHERALHDTRRPGAEIAEAYLAYLHESVALNNGALLIADSAGKFVGYACCWVAIDENVAETADSNRYGYVADTCVAPGFRGVGVAGQLLSAAEAHLKATGVSRIRIGVLASNESARRAYDKHGFVAYELVLEKRIA